MKVRELIELLERKNPDAEVTMMTQPNWPMEYALAGVAVRSDLLDEAVDPVKQERFADCTAASDVVLVEGTWLRYGRQTAWEAVRWSRN